MARVFNFSPGPAVLPENILTKASEAPVEDGDTNRRQ